MPPIMRYDLFSCVSNGHGDTGEKISVLVCFCNARKIYTKHIPTLEPIHPLISFTAVRENKLMHMFEVLNKY